MTLNRSMRADILLPDILISIISQSKSTPPSEGAAELENIKLQDF